MKHDPQGEIRSKDSVSDGWTEHAAHERARWLRATPAQRLAWLEEAIAFAARNPESVKSPTRGARRQQSDED